MQIKVDTVTLERSKLETMRILRLLGNKVSKRVLRKGARAGVQVFVKAIKQAAPVLNKGLQRSQSFKIKTYPNGNVAGIVGQDLKKQPRKSKAKRPPKRKGGGLSGQGKTVPDHFVAARTKAHTIGRLGSGAATAGGGRMKWKTSGGFRYAFGVRHRGQAGDNYIERAYMQAKGPANRAMDAKITVETDAEVDKIKATNV